MARFKSQAFWGLVKAQKLDKCGNPIAQYPLHIPDVVHQQEVGRILQEEALRRPITSSPEWLMKEDQLDNNPPITRPPVNHIDYSNNNANNHNQSHHQPIGNQQSPINGSPVDHQHHSNNQKQNYSNPPYHNYPNPPYRQQQNLHYPTNYQNYGHQPPPNWNHQNPHPPFYHYPPQYYNQQPPPPNQQPVPSNLTNQLNEFQRRSDAQEKMWQQRMDEMRKNNELQQQAHAAALRELQSTKNIAFNQHGLRSMTLDVNKKALLVKTIKETTVEPVDNEWMSTVKVAMNDESASRSEKIAMLES